VAAVVARDDTRSDADLMAAVADGDRRAFEELYARHAAWLVVRLSRRCADPHLVDEVVQDTFVAAWRGVRRWDGRGQVAAWIWGIGIRRLLDGLRHRPRATFTFLEPSQTELSAEELVLLGVEYGDAGAALAHLSPELRAVVQATVLDGLTTRDQAEAGGRAALAEGRYAAFGTTGQLVCLALAVASIAVLALRHRRYAVVLGRTA